MNIVSKYAKRIIVLKDGKIVFDGNREELFLSSNFKDFSLEKPLVLELMEYLSETLNIPFKPLLMRKI